MRKQPGAAERIKLPDRSRGIAEFLQLLLEPFALAFTLGATGRPETNAPPNLLCTSGGRRQAMLTTHLLSK